jgi:hypothetical protein
MRVYVHIAVITAVLCLLTASMPPGVMGGTEDAAPGVEERISPGGVVLGGLTELGMLGLGIAWEGVRIVLPRGCPLKDREVEDLVGARHDPYESIDVR